MYLTDIVASLKAGQNPQGHWKICAECDQHGHSELADALRALSTSEMNGFLKILEYASVRGPMNLPKANTHEMEDGNSMYEFIKGNFRIAYFYDANKIVICSHLFRKSTKKTPTAEQETANRMRESYNRAKLDSNLHFIQSNIGRTP